MDNDRTEMARQLCAPDALFNVRAPGIRMTGRGENAYKGLVKALREHVSIGREQIDAHPLIGVFTFGGVFTYRLADGTSWSETRVFTVSSGVISAIAVYRFRLADADPGRQPGSPERDSNS